MFANKKKSDFWSQIRQLNHTRSSGLPSSVDGVSGDKMIANYFTSKFADFVNHHSSSVQKSLYASFQASVKTCHLNDVLFSADEVLEAFSVLKSKKSDGDGMYSEHLKFASPAIAKSLASFFHLNCEARTYAPMS